MKIQELSYNQIKYLVTIGRVTRDQLIQVVLAFEKNPTDRFKSSLNYMTDGQLIDMICVQD